MKYLLILPFFFLTACGADGTFVNPTEANLEERCTFYWNALAAGDAVEFSNAYMETARTFIAVYCPAAEAL